MFRLRDLKNGLFQIHKKNGQAFEGTPRSIFSVAIKMGIEEKELAYAVNQLQASNHDYADFGVNGRFLFTKKDGF